MNVKSTHVKAGTGRWGRVLRRVFVGLLLLLAIKGAWFFRYRVDAGPAMQEQSRGDLLTRRAYLLSRVLAPSFGPHDFPAALGAQFQGEWALVSLSMTALAIAGLAQQFPDAAGTSRDDLERILDRALSSELSQFDTQRWQEPALSTLGNERGHVGYLGHLAIILAVREKSFPGGPHRALLGKLTPFRVSPSCQALDHDRASGAAWTLLYLGLVDEPYVQNGYRVLRERFLDRPLPGLWGVREWPRGVSRAGDVDSGPLPLGLSPAATGFAIASARRLNDTWTLQRLLDTAELAALRRSQCLSIAGSAGAAGGAEKKVDGLPGRVTHEDRAAFLFVTLRRER